jgi:flagellar biosynthesis/type III secretory pathway protein FliH
MVQALTIRLPQAISACRLVSDQADAMPVDGGVEPSTESVAMKELAALKAEQVKKLEDLEQQQQNLTQLCETLNSITGQLNELYQSTIAQNRTDIAKLAVEIARKILNWKIQAGDYDIHTVIEEALKRAPTRQDLVVRVNPEDLPRCQQIQQENPDGPFAELNLTADWEIGKACCLVETPKGVVRSFVEEHLGRIAEALEKAQ